MFDIQKLVTERNIHFAFEISLILKGILALFEIVGGVLVYFISQQFLLAITLAITQDELSEDPKSLVANFLLHSAQNFSISAQHFAALYLLAHGIIKIFLIAGLLRKKLWYYPASIMVFGLFVAYQLYRFTFTHSIWLLLLTLLDIVVIWLTWHEYRYLRAHQVSSDANQQ